jgi:hypothetical protein
MTQHYHSPVLAQNGKDLMCSTCRQILSPIYEKRRRTRIINNYRKLAQSLRIQAQAVESAFSVKATHIYEFADRLEQDAATIRQSKIGGSR